MGLYVIGCCQNTWPCTLQEITDVIQAKTAGLLPPVAPGRGVTASKEQNYKPVAAATPAYLAGSSEILRVRIVRHSPQFSDIVMEKVYG
jgi:hypothetical protein